MRFREEPQTFGITDQTKISEYIQRYVVEEHRHHSLVQRYEHRKMIAELELHSHEELGVKRLDAPVQTRVAESEVKSSTPTPTPGILEKPTPTPTPTP